MTIGGVPADFDGRCPECGIDVPAENLGLHYTVMHKGLGRIATPVRARRSTDAQVRQVTDALLAGGAVIFLGAAVLTVFAADTLATIVTGAVVMAVGLVSLLTGAIGKVVQFVLSAAPGRDD